MKKKIILSAIALLLGTSLMFANPSYYPVRHYQGTNQRDIRHDKQDIRQDHNDINKDRAQRNRDLNHGRGNAAVKKQHEINKNKRDIRHDKQDIRHDEHK